MGKPGAAMSLLCRLIGHDSIRGRNAQGVRVFVCRRCNHSEPIINREGQVFVPRELRYQPQDQDRERAK